jgi:hypothetical protein
MPQTHDVYVGPFADTCMYVTDCKDGYVLRKLQPGLTAIETWYERWNVKINEDKTQAIYFSHTIRPTDAHLTLSDWNISTNHVKFLGVLCNERITWRLQIEMIEAGACRTFIGMYMYFQYGIECLSGSIKLTLHKALIRSKVTYASSAGN